MSLAVTWVDLWCECCCDLAWSVMWLLLWPGLICDVSESDLWCACNWSSLPPDVSIADLRCAGWPHVRQVGEEEDRQESQYRGLLSNQLRNTHIFVINWIWLTAKIKWQIARPFPIAQNFQPSRLYDTVKSAFVDDRFVLWIVIIICVSLIMAPVRQ